MTREIIGEVLKGQPPLEGKGKRKLYGRSGAIIPPY
jgi:hypothetical protein